MRYFPSRRHGYTLLELLVVIVIVATLGGIALMRLDGTERSAREEMRSVELTRIREAVLRFRADTGQTPRLLAELLQSPDATDSLGGWWWRTAADPALPPARFDLATRRGWDGPYLRAEHRTPATPGAPGEGREHRVESDATISQFDSDAGAGRGLAMLLSPGQRRDGSRITSDWRLDFADADEVRITFLGVHGEPPLGPETLGLGVRP